MALNEPRDEARLRDLTDAISLEKDSGRLAGLYVARAHRYYVLGKRTESVTDYLQALDLTESLAELCHIRAMVALALCESDQKEQAAWWALGAVNAANDAVDGHLALGLVCAFSGYHECAVREFETVLVIDSSHAQARLELGKARRESFDIPGAIAAFEQYIQENPRDARGFYELASTVGPYLAISDRIERATKYYQTALELCGDDHLRTCIETKLRNLKADAAEDV